MTLTPAQRKLLVECLRDVEGGVLRQYPDGMTRRAAKGEARELATLIEGAESVTVGKGPRVKRCGDCGSSNIEEWTQAVKPPIGPVSILENASGHVPSQSIRCPACGWQCEGECAS